MHACKIASYGVARATELRKLSRMEFEMVALLIYMQLRVTIQNSVAIAIYMLVLVIS